MRTHTCDRDPPDRAGTSRGDRSEFRLQAAGDRVNAELQTGQAPCTPIARFVWSQCGGRTGPPPIMLEAGKRKTPPTRALRPCLCRLRTSPTRSHGHPPRQGGCLGSVTWEASARLRSRAGNVRKDRMNLISFPEQSPDLRNAVPSRSSPGGSHPTIIEAADFLSAHSSRRTEVFVFALSALRPV